MDFNTVAALVGSLGFPIVAVLICFWFINKLTTQHKEEMDKMATAINNNTQAINLLISKLDGKESK